MIGENNFEEVIPEGPDSFSMNLLFYSSLEPLSHRRFPRFYRKLFLIIFLIKSFRNFSQS
jgi:hypothetical protein